MYRQGDVAIVATTKKGKSLIQPVNGRVILALGEVTGHHHSIALEEAPQTQLWKYDDNINILQVAAGGATITHQEHGAIWLPEGDYEIHIQTEYDPETESRRVAD